MLQKTCGVDSDALAREQIGGNFLAKSIWSVFIISSQHYTQLHCLIDSFIPRPNRR